MPEPTLNPAVVRPKILLVDDLPANRLVLRKLLSSFDAELIEAADGPAALMACVEHDFALILMDVNMPEMDGYEVASTLLEGEAARTATPIVFVTAEHDADLQKLRGYEAGAVDYIVKPINDVVLQAKVRVFLELWRHRQRETQLVRALSEKNTRLELEIQERERAEAKALHQALHDPLTGLPNRLLFMDRMASALERSRRGSTPFAVLYVDIDGFKPVNDELGHVAGDELLRQIASRFTAQLRKADTLARLGGDEFAVVIEELTDPAAISRVGEKLCSAMRKPFDLSTVGQEVQVGASVGAAVCPFQGAQCDALLRAADSAMYEAKRGGRNRFVISGQGAET